MHGQISNSGAGKVDEKSLFETVTKIEKKTDKFNLYLNMHGDFVADFVGSDYQDATFKMQQLRLEMKGNINNWLSYRYRQRLNKGNDTAGYRDNTLGSIDIVGIGLNFNKFSMFMGKQCAAYGGIEFDLNPIEIYQYSDMIDNMTNFMSGVNFAYNFTDKQQLQFQVLNAINGSSKSMYGDYEKAKLPMVYTLNWNGNFLDVFKTRYSASIMSETKGKKMFYYALGNEFNITRDFGAYFDWMYSREGVDRKGIMTGIIGADNGYNTSKVDYMSYVLHLNYRFCKRWNVFFKGMYENAGIYKAHEGLAKGRYRNSFGYIGGLEYYPLNDSNLHFFVTYIGRRFNYTDLGKEYGNSNYNTNQFQVGFIWQMPVF
ncbi:MAG: OprO/OprP family phosphate-selective porin [Muribaculaceae bacterium]|nr:OprO/OprP family phosphate-selective porin [Muribaculaceae bacterium]